MLVALLAALTVPWRGETVTAAPAFTIWTVGNEADVQTTPGGGIAHMGGGRDVDAAFRWMVDRSGGGDVVVIRTSGGDGYNEYSAGLAGVAAPADSVTTILFRARAAASDPAVLRTIRDAESLFIAGGDQAEYLRFWKETPLEAAIAERVAAGMTIGGTSAGAVVLGEHIYSAARGSVTYRAALLAPIDRRGTFASGFLDLPGLENTVVDTHVSERNRKGRLVAFLARIAKQSGAPVRAIGLDEGTAALIDPSGDMEVIGSGGVLLLEGVGKPQRCTRKKPLTYRGLVGFRAREGATFDLETWAGAGVEPVQAAAVRGRLRFHVGSTTG